uniref:Putative secreted protein n=1 Tax=Amblyomma americanum TaxID=6943 RepID=A0A0C9SCX2_AMBAM
MNSQLCLAVVFVTLAYAWLPALSWSCGPITSGSFGEERGLDKYCRAINPEHNGTGNTWKFVGVECKTKRVCCAMKDQSGGIHYFNQTRRTAPSFCAKKVGPKQG